MKILITDPVEGNLNAFESLLKGPGIEVVTAHSGNEALGILLEEEFGLIILEAGMPQMNGLETAELIRGSLRTRKIPILFLAEPGNVWRFHFQGQEDGPIDYLFKPIDPEILRSKVRLFQQLAAQKDSYDRLAIQHEETLAELALLKGHLKQVESDLARVREEAERFRTKIEYDEEIRHPAIVAESARDTGEIGPVMPQAEEPDRSGWKDDGSGDDRATAVIGEIHDEEANPLHILLAEDNQINTRLVVGLIKNRKWTVDCAANGAEAVEKFRGTKYDLILMDIQMPEMDGMEATRKIREYESSRNLGRVPVIALSAHALKTDIEKALNSGMDDYLTKPFRPPDLYQMINRLTWHHKVSQSH